MFLSFLHAKSEKFRVQSREGMPKNTSLFNLKKGKKHLYRSVKTKRKDSVFVIFQKYFKQRKQRL